MRRALLDGGRWCALVARLPCVRCFSLALVAFAAGGLWGVVLSRARRLLDVEFGACRHDCERSLW